MEPIESPPQTSKKAFFNLAGIIPLAGYENEYGTIWPDYLNPIAVNYYPFHKSVMECAFAGCDTIWIVGNYDYIGIVKKLLGEHVIDPAMYECWYINKSGKKVYKRKIIPIMYIGMDLKYLTNCTIPFSTLYGAYMVKKVSNRISKWTKPDKYFCSFINQQYNINALYDLRKQIKSNDPFFVCHNDKTVLDGQPSAFTLDNDDLFNIIKWSKIKNNSSFSDIFAKMDIENSYLWKPDYCFDTKTWDGFREYMASPLTVKHKLIPSLFTKTVRFNKLYGEK